MRAYLEIPQKILQQDLSKLNKVLLALVRSLIRTNFPATISIMICFWVGTTLIGRGRYQCFKGHNFNLFY